MLAQYQKKMLKCNTTDISLDRQASSAFVIWFEKLSRDHQLQRLSPSLEKIAGIVCLSRGYCIVCFSLGHCIVWLSLGHCIVYLSLGHCIVCPLIYCLWYTFIIKTHSIEQFNQNEITLQDCSIIIIYILYVIQLSDRVYNVTFPA